MNLATSVVLPLASGNTFLNALTSTPERGAENYRSERRASARQHLDNRMSHQSKDASQRLIRALASEKAQRPAIGALSESNQPKGKAMAYYADSFTPTYAIHAFASKSERDVWVAEKDDRFASSFAWAKYAISNGNAIVCHGDAKPAKSLLTHIRR